MIKLHLKKNVYKSIGIYPCYSFIMERINNFEFVTKTIISKIPMNMKQKYSFAFIYSDVISPKEFEYWKNNNSQYSEIEVMVSYYNYVNDKNIDINSIDNKNLKLYNYSTSASDKKIASYTKDCRTYGSKYDSAKEELQKGFSEELNEDMINKIKKGVETVNKLEAENKLEETMNEPKTKELLAEAQQKAKENDTKQGDLMLIMSDIVIQVMKQQGKQDDVKSDE
eukprot:501884_1